MASGSEDRDKDKGTSRLVLKLDEAIGDRKYYEAHQLVRTINFRFQSRNKIQELEVLLVKTANVLLDSEQYESGTDVGNMLAKLYFDNKLMPDGSRVKNLTALVQKMRESPERVAFIENVNEWSVKHAYLYGEFNYAVARIFFEEEAYPDVWKHMLRMTDVQAIASMTLDIISKTSPRGDEIDLIVTISVLSLLADKRVSDAEAVLTLLSQRIPHITPLINCVRFTIEASKMQHAAAYATLKNIYWPSLNREPIVVRLFNSLGSIIFKIPKPKSNGLMDNFFAALSQPESASVPSPPAAEDIDSEGAEGMTLD